MPTLLSKEWINQHTWLEPEFTNIKTVERSIEEFSYDRFVSEFKGLCDKMEAAKIWIDSRNPKDLVDPWTIEIKKTSIQDLKIRLWYKLVNACHLDRIRGRWYALDHEHHICEALIEHNKFAYEMEKHNPNGILVTYYNQDPTTVTPIQIQDKLKKLQKRKRYLNEQLERIAIVYYYVRDHNLQERLRKIPIEREMTSSSTGKLLEMFGLFEPIKLPGSAYTGVS